MSGAFGNPGAAGENKAGERDMRTEDEGAEVSPLIVDAVGKALRAHFQAIADMPLPDRFLVLLAEMEARERDQ